MESDLATGATWVDERRQQQRLSHREVFSFVSGTTPLPGPLTPAPTPANPAAPRPIFGLETFEVRAAPIRQKMRFSSSLFYFLCDFHFLSLSLSLSFSLFSLWLPCSLIPLPRSLSVTCISLSYPDVQHSRSFILYPLSLSLSLSLSFSLTVSPFLTGRKKPERDRKLF